MFLANIVSLAQIPSPVNLTVEFKQYFPTPSWGGYGFVELKWEMPTTPNPTVLYFNVYRQGPNDTSFQLIANLRKMGYKDFAVAPNQTYSYYVVAYNNSSISDPSEIVTITTPPAIDRVWFTTEPVRYVTLGSEYLYDANAVSNQPNASITYSLVTGPEGINVDSSSGIVTWTPTSVGYFYVKIKAQSEFGGFAYQGWTIRVDGIRANISGVVTDDSTGLPISGVLVFFLNLTPGRHEVAITNNNGEFNKSLIPGKYKVKFYKRGYIPEFFDNKQTIDDADTLLLDPNIALNITAGLSKTTPPTFYTLSGYVLDSNGVPVRSQVMAILVNESPLPVFPNPIPRKVIALTDSLGNYSLRVAGGNIYVIFAKPFDKNYLPEFYDNKRSFQEADKILVNGDIDNINFIMDLKPVYANGLAGTVKHFTNGESIEAFVTAFKLDYGRFRSRKTVRTDSLGNYLIENLVPGEYILFAKPEFPYLPGYYNANGLARRWKEADTVIVTENGIVNGLDINLISRTDTGFAKIVGKVITDRGDNFANALVFAFNSNGNLVATSTADNYGNYELNDLPGGEYLVTVEAPDYDDITVNNSVVLDYGANSTQNKDLFVSPASITNVRPIVNNIPEKFELYQNYPNPFNPSTIISFTIPENSKVTLEVYNLIGQKISELINEEFQAGRYEINFDAKGLSSGIYLYRLKAGNYTSVKKMILIK